MVRNMTDENKHPDDYKKDDSEKEPWTGLNLQRAKVDEGGAGTSGGSPTGS